MPTIKRISAQVRRGVVVHTIREYVALVQFHASADERTVVAMAEAAGVCPGTMAKHIAGDVEHPRYESVVGILRAFGYRVLASPA